MIDQLSQLIALASQSGAVQALAQYIAEQAAQWCDNVSITKHYVVARVPGADTKKLLVLNGHMDTVAAGTHSDWKTDPFQATITEDKLYGLGACDMKAGLAIMLQLLEDCSRSQPPTDIWFVLVANEEVDGSGTAQFVKDYQSSMRRYSSVNALILEPTVDGAFCFGSKGSAFVRVALSGISAHASTPPALHTQLTQTVAACIASVPKLEKQWQCYATELGAPSVTVTGIEALSGSPNKLPGHGVVTLDVRTTPQLDAQLMDVLKEWAAPFGGQVTVLAHTRASQANVDSPLARLLQTKLKLQPQPFSGACDQVFFIEQGIDCYVLGPGSMAQAHSPNEFVEIAQLERYHALYTKIIAILEQI